MKAAPKSPPNKAVRGADMARLWDPANSTPIARFSGICTFCFCTPC